MKSLHKKFFLVVYLYCALYRIVMQVVNYISDITVNIVINSLSFQKKFFQAPKLKEEKTAR